MRATKEQANEALGELKRLYNALPPQLAQQVSGQRKVIEDFIMAACRSLPLQSTVDRHRIKRLR